MAAVFHSLPHPNAEAFEAPCAMAHPCADVITVEYPLDIKNNTAHNKYKKKLLADNPETQFVDWYKEGNVSNLIFHTDHPLPWHRV